ncbi:MAG: pseudaminic acid synthase [Rhodocyclaceae bacterium]|nr:pseudaminic acid synthase [Rhodocyclaceae bacterium]
MTEIHIGNRPIGPQHPPFLIAEMSGNHDGELARALAIVDAAAEAGAHAIKLQTYTPSCMTLDVPDGGFFIDEAGNPWRGHSLHELYEKAQTPWDWHRAVFDHAHARGLLAFSTPFSIAAVDFLETLDVPCYKVASFENGDLPLIRRVAATGKPLILSTGTATLVELAQAVEAARSAGCRELVLLKCTSNYPAEPRDANLRTLAHLQALFECVAGLSDHTLGTAVAVAGVALGAAVIEKHLTLDRASGGVDAAFSLEPEEFAQLVRDTLTAWQALGRVQYGPAESERDTRRYRRSLYIACDLDEGAELTAQSVRCVRPAGGLAPGYLDVVLGRRVRRAVVRGTPLTWDLIGE